LSMAGASANCAASGHNDMEVNGADSGGMGGSSSGSPGAGVTPSHLPVRIRRLTDAEWRDSTKALLGIDSKTAAQFTPDTPQPNHTFTVNDGQQVDPVFAAQLDAAAHEIASAAVAQLATVAPCSAPTSGGEACAKSFIASFAAAAYRRPASQSETDGLLAVYHAAADGGMYSDGIQAIIAAVLQSPGFVYVSEMGGAPSGDVVTLTDYEVASELSFLLTGAPPDGPLLAAAQAAQLSDGAVRQQQARRLLKTSAAKAQLTKVIEQWLGIEGVADTAKDSHVYPDYSGVLLKSEADAFIGEIVWNEGKGVSDLFGANWTMADPMQATALAQFYGISGSPDGTGRVSLAGTGRIGILDQGAFLSVYASATASAPVLRGVAVLRRIACIDVPPPASVNIVVVPPPPDPSKTTRQLFAVHVSDPACASCHNSIDSIGFAFENFDGEGKARTTDANPPKPVDSTTTVASSLIDLGGSYADSAQLATKIAGSDAVRQCFARYMFRYAAARSGANAAHDAADAAERVVEDAFVATWKGLPAAAQESLIEVLAAYAGSPSFVTRQVVP
jgi:uncharacterized protein DUF1592/uncharacterized protein DUF1588/uncharacterized protein DUF1595/uncharacterized protein DUF1587